MVLERSFSSLTDPLLAVSCWLLAVRCRLHPVSSDYTPEPTPRLRLRRLPALPRLDADSGQRERSKAWPRTLRRQFPPHPTRVQSSSPRPDDSAVQKPSGPRLPSAPHPLYHSSLPLAAVPYSLVALPCLITLPASGPAPPWPNASRWGAPQCDSPRALPPGSQEPMPGGAD